VLVSSSPGLLCSPFKSQGEPNLQSIAGSVHSFRVLNSSGVDKNVFETKVWSMLVSPVGVQYIAPLPDIRMCNSLCVLGLSSFRCLSGSRILLVFYPLSHDMSTYKLLQNY
jgi:hypothetical protein